MLKQFFLQSLFVLLIHCLLGCGTKTGTGAVNVSFANNTGNNLAAEFHAAGALHFAPSLEALLGVTPTIYQMKLVVMYLVENIDPETQDNVGEITSIWISNRCDSDLYQCGIGPHAGSYIVDYFDFAAGTAAVNSALNSYQRDPNRGINPGTYRYIRIDFQGATGSQDPDVANLKFGTSTGYEVRAQEGAWDIALPEPLVLDAGESFTIDLAYDLESRFYSSSDSYPPPAEVPSNEQWTCSGSGSGVPCIVEVNFSPTVTQN